MELLPPHIPSPRFGGRILVVDDDENNRDLLIRRLRLEDHHIEGAEGGRRALEMIHAGDYDLVLLDIMMPEVNGIEVLRRLRETHSPAALPVIMATAKDDSHDVADALKLGANDYVTKPLDMIVLLARIQTQLRLLWFQRESERLGRLREHFISIASHDLKSPLSHVFGYANLILEIEAARSEPNEEIIGFGRRIVEAARTMRSIVEDFLDFQALQEGQLHLDRADNDLNAIAREVIRDNETYARQKQMTLAADLDPALPPLSLDAPRIRQVVQNLVDNAIKFSPAGGHPRLRTSRAGDAVRLEVSDDGPGLNPGDLEIAFDRYARLSNKPTGGEKSSGLGLTIARFLVEAHGGRIGVHNNDGGGATFWFELPAVPPA